MHDPPREAHELPRGCQRAVKNPGTSVKRWRYTAMVIKMLPSPRQTESISSPLCKLHATQYYITLQYWPSFHIHCPVYSSYSPIRRKEVIKRRLHMQIFLMLVDFAWYNSVLF